MSAAPLVPQAPVMSVAEAMARMQVIENTTPAGDGLACFNRMYLEVTREVDSELGRVC